MRTHTDTHHQETYTYKTVDTCSLCADVYYIDTQIKRPTILWLHGGGLIFGNRKMIPDEQMTLYLQSGFNVVAVDYRLAPEVGIDAIIEDVTDAYYWLREKGTALCNADPDSLILVGHSAGAYLSLLLGSMLSPSPKAVVSFYGYGSLEWYIEPSRYYLETQPIISKEIAYQGVGQQVLAGSEFSGFSDQRWLFYLYCRQQGKWLDEVIGSESANSRVTIQSLSPIAQITPEYPPTLLLHGAEDTDVPCVLSKQMCDTFNQANIPNQIMILDNLGHMFDRVPGASVRAAFSQVITFLKAH